MACDRGFARRGLAGATSMGRAFFEWPRLRLGSVTGIMKRQIETWREMPKQKESERIAKPIIECVLCGSTMTYRDRQANGEHDYDLRYPDGVVVPVEVTESADFQIESAVGALRDRRFVRASGCSRDWSVLPLPAARINTVREKIDQYLAAIEGEGRSRFCAHVDAVTFPSVRRIFDDLRIYSGYTTVWSPPGRIYIDQPIHVAMTRVDPLHVRRAIEDQAFKLDNKKKLAAVDAPERHLFVYLHWRNYPAWVALLGSNIPGDPPVLPDEITDVWAAAPDRSRNVFVVWRFTAGQGWRDLGRITG